MVSRFNSIIIDGLFGKKEPVIIEFADQNDPVKILYGVNGSGKTTIMKIIQHSYCWNPVELFKLPFESITYSLNKRGKYNKETTLTKRNIKCHDCGYKSTICPSGNGGVDYRTENDNINFYTFFEFTEFGVSCPNCNNESVNLGFDFSGKKVDELIANLIKELSEILDELEEINRQLEEYNSLDNSNSEQNQELINNIDLKDYTDKRKRLKMERKNLPNHINKLLSDITILLSKKFVNLNNRVDYDNEYWNDGLWLKDYQHKYWNDGLLLKDYQDKIGLKVNTEFEFNTKLIISKKTNVEESIFIGNSFHSQKVEVGNYIQILERKDPILRFENNLIDSLLNILNRINMNPDLDIESLDYGFIGLFDSEENEIKLRMPDAHDYWDSDWDNIVDKLSDYRITRFGDNPNLRSSVNDWIDILDLSTNEKVKVEDFLIYHLPQDLVTHSKKGTRYRKTDLDNKITEYSPNMKTPKLIADLFDYQKILISPGSRNHKNLIPPLYYIPMPKILNISTERKNDDQYFYQFSIDYNRIIKACSKLLNSLMQKFRNNHKVEPAFAEESGGLIEHSSDIGHHLTIDHNIEFARFIETIQDEIPGAFENHNISLDDFIYFIKNECIEYAGDQIQPEEVAEVISSIVKFCEVIKLKRFLVETFSEINFDFENSRIYTGKSRTHLLKFSDLSSGIRQKFRIFTSIGMQVISSEKSLILIDEPEISLHLSWQRNFIDELTDFLIELVSKSRITFESDDRLQNIISIIISTHSPAILANHYHRGQKIGEVEFEDED